MNNKEILQKAIEKAGKNGYQIPSFNWNWDEIYVYLLDEKDSAKLIIFSHDFAKAFWGEGIKMIYVVFADELIPNISWEYHLSKMVLEPEPLKYLENFL